MKNKRLELTSKRLKLLKEREDNTAVIGEVTLMAEPSEDDVAKRTEALNRNLAIGPELLACEVALVELPADKIEVLSAEAQQRNELWTNANFGEVLECVRGGGNVHGATAELQSELDLRSNEAPIEMFRQRRIEDLAVTEAPDDVEQSVAPPLTPIFVSGLGAFIGADRPVVDQGEASYPIFATSPSVEGPHDDSTALTYPAQTINSEALEPERSGIGVEFRELDRLKYPQVDTVSRAIIGDAIQEYLDARLVAAIRADVNVAPAAIATEWDYANYVDFLGYGRVDGRFAGSASDLRLILGTATLTHAAATYRADESEVTAIDKLTSISGGVRVSPLIPAVANNLQDAIVRRGLRRDIVQPIWRAVAFTVDEVTRAAEGEIRVTASVFHNEKVLRTGGFARLSVRQAA